MPPAEGDCETPESDKPPNQAAPAPMPPQGEALTEEDVRDVVAYVKTLADTRDDPPGEFNFFLPIRTTGIEFTAHAPFRSPAGHRVQSAWYRNCASASPAVATWR